MTAPKINNRQWMAAHHLAAELAQRDFDVNIMRTAGDYLERYPDLTTDGWFHWLKSLSRLGDIFSSSNNTSDFRHEFEQACLRLQEKPFAPQNTAEWATVLGWAQRLFRYYQAYPKRAQQISNVRNITLPDKREPYRSKTAGVRTPSPTTEALPDVREEVSDKAADLFAQFQKKAGKSGKKKKRR